MCACRHLWVGGLAGSGLVGWWFGGLAGWRAGGLAGWWVGGLVVRWVGGLVGWWVSGLAGWWAGGLAGWWVSGLVGWWAGGLVGWRAGGLGQPSPFPSAALQRVAQISAPSQTLAGLTLFERRGGAQRLVDLRRPGPRTTAPAPLDSKQGR